MKYILCHQSEFYQKMLYSDAPHGTWVGGLNQLTSQLDVTICNRVPVRIMPDYFPFTEDTIFVHRRCVCVCTCNHALLVTSLFAEVCIHHAGHSAAPCDNN
jgi:hypothetical protein